MQADDIARQVARWTALGALFLIPATPLIVANSFFFPFITGKAFYFRLLVEVGFVAWVLLAAFDRAYRPRLSAISITIGAFVLWMLVADVFAVNAHKAFWSNFERMEGWVLLAHLAAFFFTASAVLRVERKWRAWFYTSLVVGALVSCYAVLQLIDPADFPIHQGSTRIDASLGNSIYLAIYLFFNLCISLWLALTAKTKALMWWLVGFAVVEGVLIILTGTRGTALGMAGGLGIAAVLTALTAGKRARYWALGGLAVLIVVAGSFYMARNTPFIQHNDVLSRIANISLAQGTTRFHIWGMAWQGFLERPVTGWGQEGFNYVFNRYYDPRLYGQEPWFDRAHNAFIDWLIAGGAPGFVLFVCLFGASLWLLWRRSELSLPERIMLTAAIVGYAISELFVFDNLYSYVYFFAILAVIHSQVGRPVRLFEARTEITEAQGTTYALPIAAVVLAVLIWYVNIPGITVASKLITALSASPAGLEGNLAAFKDLTARPAFAAQEVREQLVAFAASVVNNPEARDDAAAGDIVMLALSEMQKQVAEYPLDTRGYFQLSYAYQAAGDMKGALETILKATELTPTKEDLWLSAGMIAWNTGDVKAAAEYFTRAYNLYPASRDLAVYAAAGAYALGDPAQGDALVMGAYGTTTHDSPILATAFYQAKDWPRLVRVWQARTAKPDASPETYFSLAAAYYVAGRSAEAVATIQEVMKKFSDPAVAASGEAAIKQIRSGVPIQ